MTLRGNKTKVQRAQETEKGLEQLQMATRVSQMMLQQVGNSVTVQAKDISELAARMREIQYSVLALRKVLGVDETAVAAVAEQLQITDFEELAAKEDVNEQLVDAELISEDSTITITTKAGKAGILRSRLKVAEISLPAIKEALLGKQVGNVVSGEINGITHEITVLSVKTAPAKVEDVGQATH